MKREIHFQMWRLAGPIIISNISVPLLGAVDTAVVGHLPDAKYLGGVAVGAMSQRYETPVSPQGRACFVSVNSKRVPADSCSCARWCCEIGHDVAVV